MQPWGSGQWKIPLCSDRLRILVLTHAAVASSDEAHRSRVKPQVNLSQSTEPMMPFETKTVPFALALSLIHI